MEQEQQKSKAIEDYLNTPTGDTEGSQLLEPKEVTIGGVSIKTHNKDGEKMDNPLVEIHCKHPDKDELIKITSIKRLSDEKLITSALFIAVDNDKKFYKDSAIAFLLRFMNCTVLSELEGKKINTVRQADKSKYIALKCY